MGTRRRSLHQGGQDVPTDSVTTSQTCPACAYLRIVHVPQEVVGLGVQDEIPPQKLATGLIFFNIQEPADTVLSIQYGMPGSFWHHPAEWGQAGGSGWSGNTAPAPQGAAPTSMATPTQPSHTCGDASAVTQPHPSSLEADGRDNFPTHHSQPQEPPKPMREDKVATKGLT